MANKTSQVVSLAAPIQFLGQFHMQSPVVSSNIVTTINGMFKATAKIQQPGIIT